MNDLEARIRQALAIRADQTPVAEREWVGQSLLEEPAAGRSAGRVGTGRAGRRQLALGFATVLAAVATLAAGLGASGWRLDEHRNLSLTDQPTGKGFGGGCGGYTALRHAREAEGLRLLPAWLPSGQHITYASARADLLERETCSQLPTALVLVDHVEGDRSRIERAARLTGPIFGPFKAYNGPVQEPAEVRGVLGAVLFFTTAGLSPDRPADRLELYWTEPDGSSWILSATHVQKEELVRMAEGLVLDGTGEGPPAEAPNPPAGYEVTWQLPQRPEPLPDEEPWWTAHTNQREGASRISVAATRQVVSRPAIGLATAGVSQSVQLLEVRGHPAVFLPGQLTWDESPGVQVRLTGNQDLATLVRVAESLEQVPPDDPRIRNPDGHEFRWLLLPVAGVLAAVTAVLFRRLRRRTAPAEQTS